MAPNNTEAISSISSIDDIENVERHDKLDDGTECDKQFADVVVSAVKKKQVSIDVTKALLLLGFSSWSTLEEGKQLTLTTQNGLKS